MGDSAAVSTLGRAVKTVRAGTVPLDLIRIAFAEAVEHGQDEGMLRAHFGLESHDLTALDARADAALVQRVWLELAKLTGIEHFGLQLAMRSPTPTLMVITQLLRTAPTLGDGLRAMIRFEQVGQDAFRTCWLDAGDEVHIELRERDPAVPLERHLVEFVFARTLLLARAATGTPLTPLAISFRHPPPADDAPTRQLFGCPLTYRAATNRATVPREMLETVQLTADPSLRAYFDHKARRLEARPQPDESFIGRVRMALSEGLEHASPSLEFVAERLRMSRRTVQRRLRTDGTTLQRLLDQLRRELAVRYLDESRLSINEIGIRLSFSDNTAFHHAFVRWFGMPPSKYRRGGDRE